jgi:hypothetical protein
MGSTAALETVLLPGNGKEKKMVIRVVWRSALLRE